MHPKCKYIQLFDMIFGSLHSPVEGLLVQSQRLKYMRILWCAVLSTRQVYCTVLHVSLNQRVCLEIVLILSLLSTIAEAICYWPKSLSNGRYFQLLGSSCLSFTGNSWLRKFTLRFFYRHRRGIFLYIKSTINIVGMRLSVDACVSYHVSCTKRLLVMDIE